MVAIRLSVVVRSLLLLAVAGLAIVFVAGAASAADVYVESDVDIAETTCFDGEGCSINDVLTVLGAGDTIHIQFATLTVGSAEAMDGVTLSVEVTSAAMTGAALDITNTITVLTSSNAISIANVLQSTGAVSNTGTGTLTLTGANTYSGLTTIAAGSTLIAGSDSALGATSGDTTVAAGATLQLDGARSIAAGEDLTLADTTSVLSTTAGDDTWAGAIALTAGGAIAGSGGLTVTGAITGEFTLLLNSLTGAFTANGFNDIATLDLPASGTSVDFTDSDSLALAAGSLSGALSIATTGGITDSGTIVVSGIATFSPGAANSITLDEAASNYATLTVGSATNLAVTDTNGIILGGATLSGTLGVTAGGSITQSGVLDINGVATFTAAAATIDALLDDAANDLDAQPVFTNGAGSWRDIELRNVDAAAAVPTFPAGLRNVLLLFNNAAVTLPALTLTGDLTITSGGDVTDGGTIVVPGLTTITATGFAITLDEPANNFGTSITTTGAAITLVDTNAIVLGATTATGALSVTAGGAITQTATNIDADTTTLLSAAGFAITLGSAGNDFTGAITSTGAAITLVDTNGIVLGATTATGALSVNAGGAITQTGALAVTDTTTLTAGTTITLSTVTNNFVGVLAATAGGNIDIIDANAISLGAITTTGAGTLDVNSFGGSAITLTGAISTDGAIIFADPVVLGAATVITTTADAIDFDSTITGAGFDLTLAGPSAVDIAGAVSGVGAFSQTSTGTLGLGGDFSSVSIDTATGAITLAPAADQITTTGAQAWDGAITMGAATTFTSGAGDMDFTSTINNGGFLLTISTANAGASAAGIISGAGGLELSGGTLTLTAANTYGGTTTVSAGTLVFQIPGTALPAGAIVNNGAVTFTIANGDTTYAGAISGTGTVTKLGANQLTLTGAATYAGTTTITAGTLHYSIPGTALPSGGLVNNGAVIYTIANGDTTYAGIISGTGTVQKLGVSGLTLSGANSYAGLTTVTAGTLTGSTSNTAFGTTAGGIVVADGATLALSNIDVGAEALSLAGTLSAAGADPSYAGAITITDGAVAISGTATSFAISGTINDFDGTTDSVVTISGLTALTLSGVVGATFAPEDITDSIPTTLSASVTTVDDQAWSGALTLGASIILTGDDIDITGTLAMGANTLTVNVVDAGATITGVITGSGTLTKAGAGTLTLSGNNAAWTSAIVVTTGTLVGSTSDNAFGTTAGSTSVGNGATLTLSNIDVGAEPLFLSGTLYMSGASPTYGGAITIGDSAATIGGDATLSTISGTINDALGITDSTITFNGVTALVLSGVIGAGNSPSALVDSVPTTISASVTTIDEQDWTGALTIGATVTLASNDIDITNTVDLQTFTLTVSIGTGGPGTMTGIISGTGALVKQGTGTLEVSGANTYTGATTVSTGTLTGLTSNTAFGTTAGGITVADGAILALSNIDVGAEALSLAGTLSASGADPSYAGAITITDGAVAISGTATSFVISGTINDLDGTTNSAITISGLTALTLSGVVGGGAFAPESITDSIPTTLGASVTTAGTQAWSGALTLSAPVVLTGTAIDITSTLAMGTNTLTITNTAASTITGVITGSGTFTKAGTGTLTISGDNAAWTSNIIVSAGILRATHDGALGDTTGLVRVNSGASLRLVGTRTITGKSLRLNGGTVGQESAAVVGTWTGATILEADSSVGGGTVNQGIFVFSGTINGAFDLTVTNEHDRVDFNGVVGGTTRPDVLVSNADMGINANVLTAGTQTYNEHVQLESADVTLTTTDSNVVFAKTVYSPSSGARDLTIAAGIGTATFTGAVGSGLNAELGDLVVTGTGLTTFTSTVEANLVDIAGPAAINGGSVVTTTTQDYDGATTLNAATTLQGSTVTFGSTLDSFDATDRALIITGNAVFGGAVGAASDLASLTVSGTTSSAAAITTSGIQTFTGAFTRTATGSFTGSTVTFGSTYNGAFPLAVTGNAVFNGIVGGTAPPTTIAVSGTTTVDTTAITSVGTQAYSGSMALTEDVVFTTTNSAWSVTGAVTSPAPQDLTVAAGTGTVTFSSTVGMMIAPLDAIVRTGTGTTVFTGAVYAASVTISGATTLTDDVTTSGDQTYNGVVTVTGDDRALTSTGGDVIINAAVGLGTFQLTINVDDANSLVSGVISGTGAAALVKAGSGTLTLEAANTYTGTTTVSAGTLVILRDAGLGTSAAGTTVADGATLELEDTTEDVNVVGETLALAGTIIAHGVNPSWTGAITITDSQGTIDVSNIDTDEGDATTLGRGFTVSGNVNADTTAAPRELQIVGDNDGGRVIFSGQIGNTAPLGEFDVDNGAIVRLANNAGIKTTTAGGGSGCQYYATVELGANPVLTSTGGCVAFEGGYLVYPSSGSRTLTVTALSATTVFHGTDMDAIFPATAIFSVTVNGPVGFNDADITTTGPQVYTGAATLGGGGSTTLQATGGSGVITFRDTVDGGEDLILSAPIVNFEDDVGDGSALDTLTVTGTTMNLYDAADWVGTSGDQLYSTHVVAAINPTTFDASSGSIAFEEALDAATVEGDSDVSILVDGASGAAFRGAVGAVEPLASLTSTGVTGLSNSITTLGDQTFNDDVSVVTNGLSCTENSVILTTLDEGGITMNALALTDTTLTIDNGGDSDIMGLITGPCGLIKEGEAWLTLSGANSAWSGDITVNEGTLEGTTSNSVFGDSVGDTYVNEGATLVIDGITTNEDITLDLATLVGEGNAEAAGPLTLQDDSTVVADDGDELLISGDIEGAGKLTKDGDSLVTLTSDDNEYTGGTDVAEGELRVEEDEALGPSGDVWVADGATLTVVNSDIEEHDLYLEGTLNAITGSSDWTADAVGITLWSTAVITGDTDLTIYGLVDAAEDQVVDLVLADGELTSIVFMNAIGVNSPLNSLASEIPTTLNGDVVTIEEQTYTDTVTLTNGLTMTASYVEIADMAMGGNGLTLETEGDDSEISGPITGTGDVNYNGGETVLTLSGASPLWDGNLYAWTGDLRFTNDGSAGSTVGNTILTDGATLFLEGVSTSENLDISGVEPTVTIHAVGASSTLAGDIWMAQGMTLILDVDATFDLYLNGDLLDDDSGSLIQKIGEGAAFLTGGNTYTAGSIVAEGTLVGFSSPNPFGTGDIAVGDGATLDVDDTSIDNNVVINDGSIGSTSGGEVTGWVLLTGEGTVADLGGALTLNTVDSDVCDEEECFGLTVENTQMTTFGAIGGGTWLAYLDANGPVTLGSTVNTVGDQDYASPVLLAADLEMMSSDGSIRFWDTVNTDGTAHSLTANAGADLVFDGYLGGMDVLGSVDLTATDRITINNDFDAGSLVTHSGLVTGDGASIWTSGDQTYEAIVFLDGTTTMTANDVDFYDSVRGYDGEVGESLAIEATGTYFRGGVGDVTSPDTLSVIGASYIGEDMQTIGDQTYDGAVMIDEGVSDVTFSSEDGEITFESTLDAVEEDVSVYIWAPATFNGVVGGGDPSLGSLEVSGAVTVGTTAITTTGTQNYYDAMTLASSVTFMAAEASFETITGDGYNVDVSTDDGATFNGLVDVENVVVSGPATLRAEINTDGEQTYEGAVTLDGESFTLYGDLITFESTLDGATDLTIGADTVFEDAVGYFVALESLLVLDTTTIYGDITTNGAQTYGDDFGVEDITLMGDVSLYGSTIEFWGAIDGFFHLFASATDIETTIFHNSVDIGSLEVEGTAEVWSTMSTEGSQTYDDIELMADVSFVTTNAPVTVDGDITGSDNWDLSFNTGTIEIWGDIGEEVTPLGALDLGATDFVTIGGNVWSESIVVIPAVILGGDVMTTGDQDWPSMTLTDDVSLMGAAISFSGAIDGADEEEEVLYSLTIDGVTTTLDGDVDANLFVTGMLGTASDLAITGDDAEFEGIDIGATTLTLDIANEGALTGALEGTGTLVSQGEGTLTLTGDSSGFLGTVAINDGEFSVMTDLAVPGGLTVSGADSALSGTGAITGNVVVVGGIFVPGAEMTGMLTIVGNLELDEDSTYYMVIDADDVTNVVAVDGDVTLGGATFVVVPENAITIATVLSPIEYSGTLMDTFDMLEGALQSAGSQAFTITYLVDNEVQVTAVAGTTLSIDDVSGSENAGEFDFTVSIPAVQLFNVEFCWATVGVTATADSDFESAEGCEVIGIGETEVTISIVITNDGAAENAETFQVVLTDPIGATFADATGVGTIARNDQPSSGGGNNNNGGSTPPPVVIPPSDGGSGTDTGTGSGSTGTATQSTPGTFTITLTPSGGSATADFVPGSTPGTGVSAISPTGAGSTPIVISMTPLSGVPAGLPTPSGRTLGAFEADVTNTDGSKATISGAVISFQVPLSALTNGNGGQIMLQHYDAATNTWESLPTTCVVVGATAVCTATTTSFSPFVVSLDNLAPTLTLGVTGSTIAGTFADLGKGVDRATLVLMVDGEAILAQLSGNGYTASLPSNLAVGVHNVVATIADLAGNSASAESAVTVDEPPMVTPPTGETPTGGTPPATTPAPATPPATGETPTTPTKGSPGFELVALALAGVVAALVLRRKKN